MTSYPDWVPSEVLCFFQTLPDKYTDQTDVDVLGFAIQSPSMKNAWKAVSRRQEKANPERVAQAILTVSSMSRDLDRYATTERIREIRGLAEKTHSFASNVVSKARKIIGEDWYNEFGYPLKAFFKVPPVQALNELAEYFELTARDLEETRTELTAFVGKPGAKDARRTYVIRLMSKQVRDIYEQPLHDLVAACSSQILDEDVDPELVRKLVKIGDKLPPPYWGG